MSGQEMGEPYYVRFSPDEPLWTVGFDMPGTGSWQPDSDHGDQKGADDRARLLNGSEGRYVYWRSEHRLWTVAERGGAVLYPHSVHVREQDASDLVIELNA